MGNRVGHIPSPRNPFAPLYIMMTAKLWLPLVISLAAGCLFPELPDSLQRLAPSFDITAEVNTFGRFLVVGNSTRWTLAIAKESLVR